MRLAKIKISVDFFQDTKYGVTTCIFNKDTVVQVFEHLVHPLVKLTCYGWSVRIDKKHVDKTLEFIK